MPRDGYSVEADPAARVEPSLARLVMTENRQRLEDFVAQFDLYFKAIDGPAAARDFRFWRGYLRDMAALSRLFPEVIEGQGRPQQIGQALQFLLDIDSLPQDERAGSARRRLLESGFLLKFSPALDHRTLAELVSSREGDVDRRVASLVSDALEPLHLRYLTTAVELLAVVEERPEEAVRAFGRFIEKLEERQLDQMNFILELFAGVDRSQTKQLLTMMSRETALLVLQEGPAHLRFLTEPEALVQVLGFGGDLTLERLVELSRLANEHVIGRLEADEPFLNAAYRRIVERGKGSPGEALRVFSESGLLVEPFLRNFPEEASALVSVDLPVAAQMFRDANPVRLPPARAVYRLIQADPAAAARLTLQYDGTGERETVQDALVFFAYDDARLRAQPGLSDISLANDGRFLAELVRLRGEGWLRDQLASSRQRFERRLEAGEVEAGFIEAYKETVAAGVEALEDEERQAIERAVAGALG